jgi:hypothetical protein
MVALICSPAAAPPAWFSLDLLDHWQSLAAGLVAVVAAIIAIGGAELSLD